MKFKLKINQFIYSSKQTWNSIKRGTIKMTNRVISISQVTKLTWLVVSSIITLIGLLFTFLAISPENIFSEFSKREITGLCFIGVGTLISLIFSIWLLVCEIKNPSYNKWMTITSSIIGMICGLFGINVIISWITIVSINNYQRQ